MNKVTLLGNLGNDAELKSFSNGNSVLNFSLATSENWKDKETGERKEKTQWHRCALYGKRGEALASHLKKGMKILVEGQIEYRTAEKDGVKTYFTDIKVLDVHFTQKKGESSSGSTPPSNTDLSDLPQGDDDIPF